jgi:hypothetical protein
MKHQEVAARFRECIEILGNMNVTERNIAWKKPMKFYADNEPQRAALIIQGEAQQAKLAFYND